MACTLIASSAATAEELASIDQAVAEDVDREVEAAEKSPMPSPEEALRNVYAPVAEVEPAIVPRRS